MAKRKPQLASAQLRRLIEKGPLTKYRIAKESGVDASQLHRFVHGTGRLTTESLDKIGEVLKLRITSELEQ